MSQEIDALSIGISASSRNAEQAIDRLIGRLKNLDVAFRSLSGSTTYANNLETVVHSVTRVNNAIANMDADRISSVAKAMKDLGRSGNILSGFGNVSQTEKVLDNATSKAQTLAKSLANTFNIKDKGVITDLTRSIQTMMDTMGKGDDFYKAEKNIRMLIEDFGKVENELYQVDNAYEKVRKYLRDNTLYIPQGASYEQDFLKNRAKIGIRNTTSDPTKGIGIEKVKEDLQNLIPELKNMINPQDIFGGLSEWLDRNATEPFISMRQAIDQSDDAWYRLSDAIDNVEKSLGVVVPSLEQLSQVKDSLDFSGITDFSDMLIKEEEAIQRFRDSLQSVDSNMQNFSQTMQQVAPSSQPFDNIVDGLSQLQGISIGDFSNLTTLADGVNRLGYQSAVTAADTLPRIAEGLRAFNGSSIPNMSGIEEFAQGLRSLGGIANVRAAESLPKIADGLRQFNDIKIPKMEGLTEFAQALSLFGRKTAQSAVKTIPELATAFQHLFDVLSKAPKISQNTIDAANAMANLASKTGGATRALSGATPKLNLWSRSANNAAKSGFSLAGAIGKVYATYWMLFRAFGMIKKSIDIASDLTEVRNVVVQSFDDMAWKANEFAESAGSLFGMSKLESLEAASRYQAMGKTMGITDSQIMAVNNRLRESLKDTLANPEVQKGYGDLGNTFADMSINLTKLSADLASLYNTDIGEAAEKMNSIFTGTTKPLREFGFDLTNATLKEWALTQGIDANIKTMTQAEKAVLRYNYVMANAGFVMGDFVRTADSWHNTIVRMKLAFKNLGATIGQGFINLLKPAINKITAFVNTLTGLIQKAINAIGKLLGWQMEIDPIAPTDTGALEGLEDAMEDTEDASGGTADNLNKGAKAAKKIKDYLLGIDELNVFKADDNDSSSKGTSGGGGASGAGARGGASGGDVRFEKYKSNIKNWFDLGKTIADTIGDALWNIDWKSIQSKAQKAASNLAEFLNGIFASKKLWTGIGHTIAEGFNTALTFLETFIDKFNWGQMGRRIGDMINQAVNDFKWAKLGRTIAKGINAAFEFLWNLGITFDAKKLGEGIATSINEFFSKLDASWIAKGLNIWVDKIKELLGTILKKTDWKSAFKKLKEVWDKLEPDTIIALMGLALFGTKLGRAMGKKLGSMILKGLKTKLAEMGLKGKIIAALQKALGVSTASGALIGGAFAVFDLLLVIKVATMFTEDFKHWKENIDKYGWDEGRKRTARENQANPYNPNSKKSQMDAENQEQWSNTFDGWKSKLEEWQANNRQKRAEEQAEFDQWYSKFEAKCKTTLTNVKSYWGEKWDGVKLWFDTNVKPWFTVEKWKDLGNNIKLGIQTKWNEFKAEWGTKIKKWWDENVAPWFTVEKWKTLAQNFKTSIKNKWDETVNQWKLDITAWWNEHVAPWFTIEKWKTEADHFRESIKAKWDETVNQWKIDIHKWWNEHVVPWFKIEKWKAEADHLKQAILTKFDEMKNEWVTKITDWWNNHVKPWFSLEKWKELASNIKNGVISAIDGIKQEWGTKIDELKSDFQSKFGNLDLKQVGIDAMNTLFAGLKSVADTIKNWWDTFTSKFTLTPKVESPDTSGTTAKKATGGVFDSGRWHDIHAYASGGMPDSAQLFMAREAGPELVGTIGSNTAVINNDQIVASVAAGVQNAVIQALDPYLSEITTNTRVTANKDLTVNIGDREIAEANNRGQRSLGIALLT